MKEERLSYLSADGKTTIHGVFWIPDSTALAVLQISHGMTEYAQDIEIWQNFHKTWIYCCCE